MVGKISPYSDASVYCWSPMRHTRILKPFRGLLISLIHDHRFADRKIRKEHGMSEFQLAVIANTLKQHYI